MAVAITAETLASIVGTDSDDDTYPVATRLLAVATARVERYAPDAPTAMQDEATIRFAAYLAGAKANPNASGTVSVGSVSLTETSHSHAAAFRLCGAKGLLGPWRVRRGAVVKADE